MVSLMQHQRTIPYSPANWDHVSAVATRIAGHCGFCRCQQKLKVSESLWQIEFDFEGLHLFKVCDIAIYGRYDI